MKIILYSLLTVMALYSGFFALSSTSQETEKTTPENKEAEALKHLLGAGTKIAENKTNVQTKIIALATYVVSIASLITLYIIKG